METLPINDLFQFLFSVSIWDVAKILVGFALLLYVVFAIVVVRQVNMMLVTLGGQLELLLRVIAAVHLAGAIFILVLALIVL